MIENQNLKKEIKSFYIPIKTDFLSQIIYVYTVYLFSIEIILLMNFISLFWIILLKINSY